MMLSAYDTRSNPRFQAMRPGGLEPPPGSPDQILSLMTEFISAYRHRGLLVFEQGARAICAQNKTEAIRICARPRDLAR